MDGWILAQTKANRVTVSPAIDPISKKSSKTCGENDRTIYALSPIVTEETMVTLQNDSILNGTTWINVLEERNTLVATKLRDKIKTLEPSMTVKTVLALLNEVALGESSLFAGYIAELPAKVPLPMCWDEASRRKLKHTAAVPIVDYDLVESVYKRYVCPLTTEFEQLWPTQVATFEKFLWAYSIVSSRAFAIDTGGEPTLLPVIDMANHSADSVNAIIRKEKGNIYSLVALREISIDEPITISYGDLSNAQLLCRYGFVLPSTVASDCILISSSELRAVYARLSSGGTSEEALIQLEMLHTSMARSENEPTPKRRKFPASDDGPVLFFALHGNPSEEFGISDTLLSFVFANDLSTDLLYEVLIVLLQYKDKCYTNLLKSFSHSDPDIIKMIESLASIERQVSRRILLGIMALEEESDDEE